MQDVTFLMALIDHWWGMYVASCATVCQPVYLGITEMFWSLAEWACATYGCYVT